MKRKLRMGLIGGGKDAFIGAIHRFAFNMDGLVELVCGALSINPEIAKDSGQSLFLPEDRIYLNYEEMIEKERQRGMRLAVTLANQGQNALEMEFTAESEALGRHTDGLGITGVVSTLAQLAHLKKDKIL